MIRARRCLIASAFPIATARPIVYDSGDYPKACKRRSTRSAASTAFRSSARGRRAREGRYLGLGLGCYVEGTGVGPFESAAVRIDPTGKVYVASGACPQGQGMETIFSQVVADAWKVKPDDVVMALADTSAISIGFGTIASRSTVTLSSAIHFASEILREKVFRHRRQHARMRAGRSRAAQRRDRRGRRARQRGHAGQRRQGRAPGLGSRPPARHARPASRRPITTSRRP